MTTGRGLSAGKMSPSCHIPCELLALSVGETVSPRGSLAVPGMGPGLLCESGGTQGGQVPGPAWCPQPLLLQSRVSHPPAGSHLHRESSGLCAQHLLHPLCLGAAPSRSVAEPMPVAGQSSLPIAVGAGAGRGLGSLLPRGHSGISVLCSAAAVAVWYQRCEDTWARSGPLLLGRAFCFFPPPFFFPSLSFLFLYFFLDLKLL